MTSLAAPAFMGRAPTRVALPLRRVSVAPSVVRWTTARAAAPPSTRQLTPWAQVAQRTHAVRVHASALPHDAKQRGHSHAAVTAKATGTPGAGASNPSAAPPVELGGGSGSGTSHIE